MATNLPLLTIPQAVELTNFSRGTLYQAMRSGRLEYVTYGRTRRVPQRALEAFVASLSAARVPVGVDL